MFFSRNSCTAALSWKFNNLCALLFLFFLLTESFSFQALHEPGIRSFNFFFRYMDILCLIITKQTMFNHFCFSYHFLFQQLIQFCVIHLSTHFFLPDFFLSLTIHSQGFIFIK